MHIKPVGVVLVLSPWNFPMHIPISAMGDILGAGNRVVIKPSEVSPKTSALLAELVAKTFPPDVVSVFTGGPEVAATLSSRPFDHILFVGSGAIGKKILAAAAPNLTKVTLELGGKNPGFICPDVDLKVAAQTVAMEKLENAGQVCTGIDTVFVAPDKAREFVGHMRDTYKSRWGEDQLGLNSQYVSCVNEQHFQRVKELLNDAKARGADIISLDPTGCESYDSGDCRLPPHAVLNPPEDALISQREIFGPLLVVREMELRQAISYVNSHEEPLACYVFTDDERTKDMLATEVRCGGMTVNQINKHTIIGPLPFGGMGPSGMGVYHGVEGFMNFSHRMSMYDFKPVGLLGLVWQKIGPNISLPYSDKDVAQIKDFLKPLPPIASIIKSLKICLLLMVAYLMRHSISSGFIGGVASTLVVTQLMSKTRDSSRALRKDLSCKSPSEEKKRN
jgi:coniferyl-aldehyde dehydrogenase